MTVTMLNERRSEVEFKHALVESARAFSIREGGSRRKNKGHEHLVSKKLKSKVWTMEAGAGEKRSCFWTRRLTRKMQLGTLVFEGYSLNFPASKRLAKGGIPHGEEW
jgi:hypothetical protein